MGKQSGEEIFLFFSAAVRISDEETVSDHIGWLSYELLSRRNTDAAAVYCREGACYEKSKSEIIE